MTTVPRAHDLLVNTDMGDVEQPEWMVRVKEDYFKAGASMFTSRELGELLDDMDENGVERAVLDGQHGRIPRSARCRSSRPTPSGSASAPAATTC